MFRGVGKNNKAAKCKSYERTKPNARVLLVARSELHIIKLTRLYIQIYKFPGIVFFLHEYPP